MKRPSDYELVFLQSRVNGADYREPEHVNQKWDWPRGTFLQRRRAELAQKEEPVHYCPLHYRRENEHGS